MLPTNFSDFYDKIPQARPALESLAAWRMANPHVDYIDIRRIVSERPEVNAAQLAFALVVLEKHGLIKGKFGLIAPTNYALADRFFDSLEEIPTKALDTTDRVFPTDNAEVIPIYVGTDR
ncbi:hypothetical protein [Paludisphaera mucosa]|uniref:Uncharacterized protein n=1 Tax=Paludisphaera mucosa TaxID=3030827 RepID=A0ABT6FIM6_9BACT|nr:hypothetical protein [Paludisphaera mucosa]MDG3007346.1 hypothetical protein [Paludisphaera mucosa]